jgi:hypothetical protein
MTQSKVVQLDFLAKVLGLIASIINLVIAISGILKLSEGDTKQVTLVLLSVGGACLATLWLACAYFAFKRTVPLIEKGKGTWQYPRLRLLALGALVVISLLTVGSIIYYFYQEMQPPSKVILLVANFDGPDPQKYGVTDHVLARLRTAL